MKLVSGELMFVFVDHLDVLNALTYVERQQQQQVSITTEPRHSEEEAQMSI